jgi:hypothetical protein
MPPVSVRAVYSRQLNFDYMKWKERLTHKPENLAPSPDAYELDPERVIKFIETEIIENLINDSKTMTPEQLRDKWLN